MNINEDDKANKNLFIERETTINDYYKCLINMYILIYIFFKILIIITLKKNWWLILEFKLDSDKFED